MVTIDEYRKTMNDYESPDELVLKRLDYLESMFRNIIKGELKAYLQNLVEYEKANSTKEIID